MAVLVALAVGTTGLAGPAEAHHDPVHFPEYVRQDRVFRDLRLRDRGYLPEHCLLSPVVPCVSSPAPPGVPRFRAEATAQARAIQSLVAGRNPNGGPAPAAHGWDKVHWEVSDPPGTTCPEPPSNTVPPDPASRCWRADVRGRWRWSQVAEGPLRAKRTY